MSQISYAGAFNSATLNIPDVYLNILAPAGSVIRPATIGLLAVLGIASWGPVNVATPIGNLNQLAKFGSQQNRKYDLYTAAALALQVQAAQGAGAGLVLNRVTDGADTAASAQIGLTCTAAVVASGGTGYAVNDTITLSNGVVLKVATLSSTAVATVTIQTAAATSQPTNPVAQASTSGSGTGATFTLTYTKQLTLTSLYTGSAANLATATIAAGSAANSSRLTVVQPGFAPEIYDNITGTGNAFWVNAAAAVNSGNSPQRGPSKLVVATAGTAITAPVDAPTNFSGGTAGATALTSAVLSGTAGGVGSRTGSYSFRGMGATHGVVADLDDHTQNATLAAFAQSEGIYWGVQNTAGDTPSAAATQKATDGTDTPWLKLFMGDWTYVNDNVNGVQRLLGPATLGMSLLSTLQPYQSGLNKQVPLVVSTQGSQSNSSYANTDLAILTNSGIEVICNPIPAGSKFGLRIGRNASSNQAQNTDNWPVMTAFLARSLAGPGALGPAIGKAITPDFFTTWRGVLDNFLAGLLNAKPSPMIQAYSILFDVTNNPASQTATGLVVAEVLVQYLGIAQVFLVNLQTGATVVIPPSSSNFAQQAA